MDLIDQGFNSAKPVKKVNKNTLKQAIKEFIKKNFRLPIIQRTFRDN